MSEATAEDPGPSTPPVTGNRLVDQAMAEVAELPPHDPAEHHVRLAAAQDVLVQVLETSRSAVQTPIPGVLRPAGSNPARPGAHHG